MPQSLPLSRPLSRPLSMPMTGLVSDLSPLVAALDPIAWYRSGEGLEGAVGVEVWRDRGTGGVKGVWFDGVDDEVNTGNGAATNFDHDDEFAIGGDFQTASSGTQSLVSRSSPTPTFRGYAAYTSGGKLLFRMYYNGTSTGIRVSSDGTFDDGLPHSFLVTYSGSGAASGVTMYVDGDPISSSILLDAGFGGSVLNSADCVLGRFSYGSNPLDGWLGNVKIYSDEAATTLVSHWIGTGPNDSDWEDQAGSNDGTVSGSPSYAVTTPTGYREARELISQVDPAYGVDNKGRTCPKGTGTEWMQVDYGVDSAQPNIRAIVFNSDAIDAAVRYYCDGGEVSKRAIIGQLATDKLALNFGTELTSTTDADTSWHTLIVSSDASDVLYLDGVSIKSGDAGAEAVSGLTLFADYLGANFSEGSCAELIDIGTSNAQAIADVDRYLKWRHGV